ncbi:MAG: SOS response-associated peptidase [Halioglobus sp.]
MCGRFNVIDNPGLQELLRDLGIDLSLPSRVNVAPTETVNLIRQAEGARAVHPARWWLTPPWAPAVDQKYAMFNARSEGLARSRAFAQPFKRQRGIVPVSDFIEWRQEEGGKQPWLISNAQRALAIAALWDVWEKGAEPLLSCTLVTTAAAPSFEPWHKRMPVLLAADEWERWLDNEHEIEADDALFSNVLKYPLRLARLPRAVSNARNKNSADMECEADVIELSA